MERKKLEEVWEVHENKNQRMNEEKAIDRIWERLGELKEMQEERVQKKKTQQEVAQTKENENIGEDVKEEDNSEIEQIVKIQGA